MIFKILQFKPAHCMSYLCVFKRSPLGVKIYLSHAQIGLLQGSQKARVKPRWSPLGVKFKIYMGVPPPNGMPTSTGALQTTYPGQKRADKRTFNRRILLIIERSKPTNEDDRLHTSIPANTIKAYLSTDKHHSLPPEAFYSQKITPACLAYLCLFLLCVHYFCFLHIIFISKL